MFFFISKVLAFVSVPVVWLFALLAFAVFSKNPVRKRKMLLATFIAYYVLGNSFIFDEFMRIWEVPAMRYQEIKEPYDAGIVLGGVISYDPIIDRYQFRRQGDRVIQAVLLYRAGKIKKIVFSGGAGDLNEPQNKEGPKVKAFLLAIGIPEADILIEGESRNTRQNAVYTKVLLDKNFQHGRYLLITSGSHERRAVKCFEKIGVPVTPFSADRYSGPRKFEFEHLFIPDARTFSDWEVLVHEVVGLFIYKIAGYA